MKIGTLAGAVMVGGIVCGCVSPSAEHRIRGNAYAGRGEHRRAVAEFDRALALRPNDAPTLTLKGNSQFELNDLDGAEASYRAALRSDPATGDAHVGLAILYTRKNEPRRATEEFEALLRINPRDLPTLNNLGKLYLSLGDLGAARRSLERAVRLQPNDVVANYNLGKVALREGRIDAAAQAFGRVRREAPAAAYAPYGLAAVALKRGDRDGALRLLGEAIQIGISDRAEILRDPDFAEMKEDPALVALVAHGAHAAGGQGAP